jgi:hypothetical protein
LAARLHFGRQPVLGVPHVKKQDIKVLICLAAGHRERSIAGKLFMPPFEPPVEIELGNERAPRGFGDAGRAALSCGPLVHFPRGNVGAGKKFLRDKKPLLY